MNKYKISSFRLHPSSLKIMRAVIQKVSRAKVSVDEKIVGEIGAGVMIFLGVSRDDYERDALYLLDKILNLRIFEDADGKMNRSLLDANGEMLVVSQFTLYGDARRGRRPSFIEAAAPGKASELYEFFVSKARRQINKVETGKFQAMMNVESTNAGPTTILLDSAKLF